MRRPRHLIARGRRGGTLIESVLIIPPLVILMVGGMEMGKIALTYYQIQKALNGAARMASLLRGADFCNQDDPQLSAIRNFIVYGPDLNTASPAVRDLTPDAIVITPERADTDSGALSECTCGGPAGCLLNDGGRPPDYVLLTLADGYPFLPRIPFRTLDRIFLRPHVRVPFGGQ